MIKFKNINGDVFLAVGSIKRKSALNGEKSLSGTLFEGDDVLNKIDKGWSLEFGNEPYVVTYFERNDNDNTVEFDAIHKFFWDMTKDVLYFSWSGSHTAKAYLDQIFDGTGYTYALNFEPSAFEKDNWGMKNKLSLFNDVIDSVGGEFEINGTLVSIFKNIGSDLSTIVRHGFNLSDMSLENDNTDFVTYGEGFGAYADQENQTGERLHVTYTSPLAKTFGKLHAEPIDDQRYTIKDNLLQAIKDKVDGSFAISIKLSLYDLTAAGYPYKMANIGDWLLAIDENLDFKQKIRIISVDDEFATDGTRISYTVTCGDIGVVQKYQQANASLGQKVDSAYQNAQDAKESSIQAVIAANGKNTNYYVNGIDNLPATANEGDIAFVQTGDGQAMYIWTKMPDGSFKWVKRLDPDTGEQIATGVDLAIETANSQAAEMDEVRASEAAVFQSEANAALSSGAAERAAFSSNATSMANSVASRASSLASSAAAYGKAQAASALSSANDALTTAKSDLTDDISVAKSEAIEAAKTADGVVKKQITDTADSINLTISQNKSDADGKIKTAQTAATQALDGLKAKVDQTTYDTKTGQLDKAVGSAALTADSAALSIKNYQSTADGKLSSQAAAITANSKAIDTKVSQTDFDTVTGDLTTKYGQVKTTADAVTAEVTKYETANDKKVSANTASINALNNQITSKVSQTDFDKTTGDLSGKYSVQQQTINGISQTVTELQAKANAQGQVNQLMNTEFNPDLEGWTLYADKGSNAPYASFATYGSRGIGFNTVNADASTFARLSQTILLPSTRLSTDVMSLTWRVNTRRMDNYCHIWLVWQDVNGVSLGKNTMGNWNDSTLNKYNVLKWENISIPIDAKQVDIRFETREGTNAYIFQPMVSFTNTIGDYVPGNYNSNARVAAVELGIDHITGLVMDPKNGLSATATLAANGMTVATKAQSDATTAIQTAKGTQTTVTSVQKDVKDLQSTTTQTAGQVTTEIEDRKNGDKNTLTQTSQMISDQIADYNLGVMLNMNAMANGIYTSISTPNQLLNTEFNPDLEGWSATADTGSKAPYRSYFQSNINATVVGFNTTSASTSTYARLQQTVQLPSTPGSGHAVSMSWYAYSGQTDNYNNLWMKFYDKTGAGVGTNVVKKWADPSGKNSWNVQNKWENITVPDTATSVQVSFEAREGTSAYLGHPMLVFGSTIGDAYMPGTYSGMNTSTVLQLFKDHWAIGIQDNTFEMVSGIIGDNTSMNLISNNITLQGTTTVTEDFYAKGGNFKNLNASNITTGTINAAKINVINLDVSSLSGNITNFVKSYWSDAYDNVTIAPGGMAIIASTGTDMTISSLNATGAHFQYGNITANYQFTPWKDSSGKATNAIGLNLGAVGSDNSYMNFVGTSGASYMLYAGSNMNYGANANIVKNELNIFSKVNIRSRLEFKSNPKSQPTYIEANELTRSLNFYTDEGFNPNSPAINYFWFNHNVSADGTFNGASLLSKKNVKSNFDTDALSEIAKTQLVNFEYKNNVGENHVSPIIDDINEEKQYYVPEKILSKDKEHVDMYSMISMAWKAIQQLNERINS